MMTLRPWLSIALFLVEPALGMWPAVATTARGIAAGVN